MLNYTKAKAGKLGAEKSKITNAIKKQDRIDAYNLTPNQCKHCSKVLEYKDRYKLFCNSSCSATFNNLKRSKKIRSNPTQFKETRVPVKWNCLSCNKEHTTVAWRTGKYCSNTCQQNFQSKERVRQWLEEGKDWGLQIPSWVHKTLAEQRGYACEVCGLSEWNSKPIKLECDHIDGDHTNNNIKNLRLICPNCHSQTDTYKAKNKGRGRQHRRKLV